MTELAQHHRLDPGSALAALLAVLIVATRLATTLGLGVEGGQARRRPAPADAGADSP